MKLVLALLLSLVSTSVLASTFCVGGLGQSPQCIYDDVANCRRAATPPNTVCLANPEATLSFVGGARYCTLDSQLAAQCLYTDRNQCNEEAGRQRAICIDREGMGSDNLSPFHFDDRIQN